MALDSLVSGASFLDTLNQQDYTFGQMHERLRAAGKVWRGPIGFAQTLLFLSTEHYEQGQGTYFFESRKVTNTTMYHLAFH